MGVDMIVIKISTTYIIYFFDIPKYTYSAVTFQKNRNIVINRLTYSFNSAAKIKAPYTSCTP
jgi:hypothetical protein